MAGFIRESGPTFIVQRPSGSVTLYRYKLVSVTYLVGETIVSAQTTNMYRSLVLVMTSGTVYEVYNNGSTGEVDVWLLKEAGTPPEPSAGPKAWHKPR